MARTGIESVYSTISDENKLVSAANVLLRLDEALALPDPEAVAKHAGGLVVAQRINEDGTLTHVKKPVTFDIHRESLTSDEYQNYLLLCRQEREVVPAPAFVGELQPFNDACFAIEQINDAPTALVPYEPRFPYMTHLATIVEQA